MMNPIFTRSHPNYSIISNSNENIYELADLLIENRASCSEVPKSGSLERLKYALSITTGLRNRGLFLSAFQSNGKEDRGLKRNIENEPSNRPVKRQKIETSIAKTTKTRGENRIDEIVHEILKNKIPLKFSDASIITLRSIIHLLDSGREEIKEEINVYKEYCAIKESNLNPTGFILSSPACLSLQGWKNYWEIYDNIVELIPIGHHNKYLFDSILRMLNLLLKSAETSKILTDLVERHSKEGNLHDVINLCFSPMQYAKYINNFNELNKLIQNIEATDDEIILIRKLFHSLCILNESEKIFEFTKKISVSLKNNGEIYSNNYKAKAIHACIRIFSNFESKELIQKLGRYETPDWLLQFLVIPFFKNNILNCDSDTKLAMELFHEKLFSSVEAPFIFHKLFNDLKNENISEKSINNILKRIMFVEDPLHMILTHTATGLATYFDNVTAVNAKFSDSFITFNKKIYFDQFDTFFHLFPSKDLKTKLKFCSETLSDTLQSFIPEIFNLSFHLKHGNHTNKLIKYLASYHPKERVEVLAQIEILHSLLEAKFAAVKQEFNPEAMAYFIDAIVEVKHGKLKEEINSFVKPHFCEDNTINSASSAFNQFFSVTTNFEIRKLIQEVLVISSKDLLTPDYQEVLNRFNIIDGPNTGLLAAEMDRYVLILKHAKHYDTTAEAVRYQNMRDWQKTSVQEVIANQIGQPGNKHIISSLCKIIEFERLRLEDIFIEIENIQQNKVLKKPYTPLPSIEHEPFERPAYKRPANETPIFQAPIYPTPSQTIPPNVFQPQFGNIDAPMDFEDPDENRMLTFDFPDRHVGESKRRELCQVINNPARKFFEDQVEIQLKKSYRILGFAEERGDCFFDSVAKQLNTFGLTLDKKKVRMAISEYLCMVNQNPELMKKYMKFMHGDLPANANHEVENAAQLIEYQNFCINIDKCLEDFELGQGTPIWGNAFTAQLIADIYEVEVHIFAFDMHEVDPIECVTGKPYHGFERYVTHHNTGDVRTDSARYEVCSIKESSQVKPSTGKIGSRVIELVSMTREAWGHWMPVD